MEILWPLILFLILVAVRTRGLRKFYHECKFIYFEIGIALFCKLDFLDAENNPKMFFFRETSRIDSTFFYFKNLIAQNYNFSND